MQYFAGLDVSMEETHICVVDRDGAIVHQAKVHSTPADLEAELARAPACRRIVFETGRMAPMLYHGLLERGLPVVCVESRQAHQALKSLATHKTEDAGLDESGLDDMPLGPALIATIERSLLAPCKKVDALPHRPLSPIRLANRISPQLGCGTGGRSSQPSADTGRLT
jgi:hypothetical protein